MTAPRGGRAAAAQSAVIDKARPSKSGSACGWWEWCDRRNTTERASVQVLTKVGKVVFYDQSNRTAERLVECNNMTTIADPNPARIVTSKEALRHWKEVTDKALREPVVITAHGRPRHVLLAYEDYERLRDQERQVYLTSDLPVDLASAILDDLDKLRDPSGAIEDGDTIIG